jgi:DeoR/GlpR family transcriptional regulator of sugar metabolism
MVEEVTKQDLIRLFEEGKSETEAFEELSNTYSSNSISLKIVSNWFTKFKLSKQNIVEKKKLGRKPKFSDEFLISLVNENPDMNMKELARLANTTTATISKKLNRINIEEGGLNYIKKGAQYGHKKFTDEFLINLINENPNMSMNELAKLANTTYKTISKRLKQINSKEQRANYTVKDFKNTKYKFTEEYLINLIKENPEIDSFELAKLVNTSQQTVYLRLRKINSTRSSEDKIVLNKNSSKTPRKSRKIITDDYLINLVNENPELDAYELAKLSDVSASTIYKRLESVNTCGQKVNYTKKGKRSGIKKFTDEFLINLVNENPEFTLKQLAEHSNSTTVTVKKRLKQVNTNGKCVNYVNKDFKHTVKKFTDESLINLVSENPEFDTRELAKLIGTSQSTISRRLREIDSNSEQSANYIKREFNNGKKFTDEFLIKLVKQNPDLSMAKLAKLANVSPSTISRRLRQINSNGEKIHYLYKA